MVKSRAATSGSNPPRQRVVVDAFAQLADEEKELLARRCSLGRRRAGGFDQGARVGIDGRLEQPLLAREVGVGSGGSETGLAGDVGHGRAPEPVDGEALHRDVEEALAGPLALPGRHGQRRCHSGHRSWSGELFQRIEGFT
jgi:hypothetical protein